MTGKTLARPYALAAFEYAEEKNAIAAWESALAALAQIADDSQVKSLLANPNVTAAAQFTFFKDVLGQMLTSQQVNFIHLLSEKGRLPLLPDILALYRSFRSSREKTIEVKLSTAVSVDDRLKIEIAAALKKRLQQEVLLECEVDPGLIGGAVVQAGDLVIDGSVRGKLRQLLDSLSV